LLIFHAWLSIAIEEDKGNNVTPPPSVIDLLSEGTTSFMSEDSGAVEEVVLSPERSNGNANINMPSTIPTGDVLH
jgi:hypothetical protein